MSHPTNTMHRTGATMRAATAARHAPSILNTQPWRWRIHPDRMELFADRSRQLTATDPQGRMLTVSCGAALHHARISLAAAGRAVHVTRLADPEQPDLLAVLTVTGIVLPDEPAARLAEAITHRHTDRRPVSDQPLPDESLRAVVAAARAEAGLHVLTAGQIIDLASAAQLAAAVQNHDRLVRAELAFWTSSAAPIGTGLPPEVLPDHPAQTTVPYRDFGRTGNLLTGDGHDRAAVHALLFGDGDEPRSWLHSGEALSAAWLTATVLGVSVLPLSDVIAVAYTRQRLRRLLAGLGCPHLVLRLGMADPDPAGHPQTPRLSGRCITDVQQ